MGTRFHDGARAGCAEGAARDLALFGVRGGGGELLSARALLDGIFSLEPERFLRRMPGRETFSWPEGAHTAANRLLMKRYRGGEARDWWYERLRGPVRSPARREWENLANLAADGLPVPRAVAWAEEPDALRRTGAARSAVLMSFVEHAGTLREQLANATPERRRALGEALALLVSRLHGTGWYHRDLYMHQVVVRSDGTLVLLDVGRARRERAPRQRWFVKDLGGLLSSVPSSVSRSETLRWLARYLELRGDLHGKRRGWARAVSLRAARIAAHVPKHIDPESVE